MRYELADFLRRRREALSPAMAGLRGGTRRRTPGLRRDEVARMANMSTNYYERLEQGRGPQPSTAILAGLAKALRLDSKESAYLYELAGHVAPAVRKPDDFIDPKLLSVMRTLAATSPAFVADELATVMAQNELHVSLFGRFAGLPGWEGNMFWSWFVSGRWRSIMDSPERQEAIGRSYVAYLRIIVAQRNYDADAVALVTDLRAKSAEFSLLWEEHQVSASYSSTVSVLDERVGRLDFDFAVMVSSQSRQRLHTLHAVSGTPTQQRLARLIELLP
ncbi:transcriptional regulator with XRE-family HTH domain [Kibdelosporangium banguiense]|uniref:Transcriptional regulator with XRE-family HTH domain n=1 Tax=Kibdelosporangium banguiense TaxID=1365924 RepID=A0ABS4TVJ2_9PSEU|nr:helix-turn-helix transcriptional regulator [Kibdelosporangium banguiense]MBP2328425.1 transcriptional regulator with XRE-family HTH domain [Kibdelosporangium banguiense]